MSWTKEDLAKTSDAALIDALLEDRRIKLRSGTTLNLRIHAIQFRLKSGSKFDEDGTLVM